MSTGAAEGYEGGVGGKLRTRQLRRAQVTPYDRPPAAARGLRGNRADAAPAAGVARGGGWISKLVDPASTLITKGATRLLSSVFPKRLAAESPAASFGPRQADSDVSDSNPLPEIQEHGSKYKDDSGNHANDDAILELEQLLKRKTFTREECDHLTELLRSRTLDLPREDENKRIEPSTLLPAGDYKKQEDENFPPQEHGIISTPGHTLKIPEEDVASPVEVAKAYMGSRPSKVSPCSLSLRSQMLREASASPNFIDVAPKSSATPIFSKSIVHFSGVSGTFENAHITPRCRGRPAIYKMSCSPYFKGQPTASPKDEPIAGGYPGSPMPTQWTPANLARSSGKQVLKQRSSVLESDLGSIGHIQRIRQKSSLVSPLEGVISGFPGKFVSTQIPLDDIHWSPSMQKLLHEDKYDTLKEKISENQEERKGYASVPLQSRETAKKILQQLDKLVPSPKGESTGFKTISRDRSPPKQTFDVLCGPALNNEAEVDASKSSSMEADGKVKGSNNFHAVNSISSIFLEKEKVENGPSKLTFGETKMSSEVKGTINVVPSIAETRHVQGSLASFSHCTAGLQQKKPAFKMQAPEESLELEEDRFNGRDVSGPSAFGKEKVEMNGQMVVFSETALSCENMPASNIMLRKLMGKGVSDGPAAIDKDTGFKFQVSLPPSTQCQVPPTPTVSSSALEESVPSSGQNTMPLFTFGAKSTPLIFSSGMMNDTDSASLKFGAGSDLKGQLFGSSPTTMATTTASMEFTESDKAEKTQEAGDLLKSVETSSPLGLSIPTTSNRFQWVVSSTSSQSNGSLAQNSSIFSISSASAASPSVGLSSSIVSAVPDTVNCYTGEPSSSLTFAALPSYLFGVSSAVSTDSSSSVVKPVSTDLETKLIKESPFVLVSSSAMATSTLSDTGSSIFGLRASASSGATSGSNAGVVFGSMAAQSDSGTLFAQGATSKFGSAASPAFSEAGSSFGFSSSVFGSSFNSVKPFGCSSGLGPSQALPSSAAAGSSAPSSSSLVPPSKQSSSVFGSSSQSTVSSIFGSGFGPSACPSGSTFGVSSATWATTLFGSSSMSPFSDASSSATSSVFSFTQEPATSSSAFSFSLGATMTSAPLSPAVPSFLGNDQMNIEESMPDDTARAGIPVTTTFGQSSNVPAPSLMFGAPATPPGAPVFKFSSSQPSAFPQSQAPFQATGSFEVSANLSMGSTAGDKAARRFIKARRDKHRKK